MPVVFLTGVVAARPRVCPAIRCRGVARHRRRAATRRAPRRCAACPVNVEIHGSTFEDVDELRPGRRPTQRDEAIDVLSRQCRHHGPREMRLQHIARRNALGRGVSHQCDGNARHRRGAANAGCAQQPAQGNRDQAAARLDAANSEGWPLRLPLVEAALQRGLEILRHRPFPPSSPRFCTPAGSAPTWAGRQRRCSARQRRRHAPGDPGLSLHDTGGGPLSSTTARVAAV